MADWSDRVVLLGADGMLGRAFRRALASRCPDLLTPSPSDVDLYNDAAIRSLTGVSPTAIINCAAWTDVDGAESHEDEATRLNGAAVETLAEVSAACGAQLIHFSTDYVFRGEATEPYKVNEPRAPLNAYGRSKAVGEIALEASNAHWLCARTSWLYAPWGQNFVLTMRRLLRERSELSVVNDQRGRPTSATQLAERTIALLDAKASGMVHLTDNDECTWFEFTRAIAELIGAECDVRPCTSDQFPRPAKRPAYSVLDLRETSAALGPPRAWRDALAQVLRAAETSDPSGVSK